MVRVLDAAANRAREGLRVIEDYVRFLLDDQHLTELCKQLRHDLTAATSQIPAERRMAARETQDDVGTMLTASAGAAVTTSAKSCGPNFARLQESLRSLEEFGKLCTGGERAEGPAIPPSPGQRPGDPDTAEPISSAQRANPSPPPQLPAL